MKGHFLQSKEWEEFQRSLGREVFRAEGVLFVKLPLAFGKSYLYSAGTLDGRSPETIFAPRKGETATTPLSYGSKDSPLKSQKLFPDSDRYANAVFLKIEPMLSSWTVPAGFVKSKKESQPQKTIVLDISGTEERILAGMHAKTRYNIKVAERKELRIENLESSKKEAVESFWKILKKTTARDKFSSHDKEYYFKLVESFGILDSKFKILNSYIRLFCAYQGDTMIAANIILFYGDTAYYLHGASDYEHRSLMAPYLLHWEIIKYAKEHGYKTYDFWGIDDKKWPGVTRFKRGFGGKEVEYVGSYDHVFSSMWYWLYKLRSFLHNL